MRCGLIAGSRGPEQASGRQEVEVSDQEDKNSDLVEIVKRNGEFRKWGMFWGPVLYWRTLNVARPRSFWWSGLIGLGTVAGGLVLKYGLPTLG
jgi:hypothetical protein